MRQTVQQGGELTMGKYRVYGTKILRVEVEIEANSYVEAINKANERKTLDGLIINYEEEPEFDNCEPC